MGHGAAFDLVHNSPGVEQVTVADADLKKAEAVAEAVGMSRIDAHHVDAANHSDIARLMQGHDSAISCVNYWYNESLSRAAIETQTNFCDLGGNNYVVDAQLLSTTRQGRRDKHHSGLRPRSGNGLYPGDARSSPIRAALRRDPHSRRRTAAGEPPLDYQLVFSVEGLINEYIEVARVIRNGEIKEVPSMTELESLEFEGFPPLEAFQTSGGTSTLPDTFLGKIKELDYKTIRYAGHCEKFKAMIDLGLCSSEEIVADFVKVKPRKVFGELLQKHLPADGPDYVLVRLEFVGAGLAAGRRRPRRIAAGRRKRLRYDIVDKLTPKPASRQ